MSNTVTEPVVSLTLPISQVNLVLKGLSKLSIEEGLNTLRNVEQQAQNELSRQQQFLAQQNTDAQPQATPISPEAT